MRDAAWPGVAIVFLLTAALGAQRPLSPQSTDLVELDVVVTDRDGHGVGGLSAQDFRIRDDGRAVDIKTFREVTATGAADAGRSLVLLLDDSGVPMGGTSVIQALATAVLAPTQPGDDVTVIRLNNDRDEPFGDAETALLRIADYHGGAVPFQRQTTPARALDVVASIARQLESIDHRRKIVVCIGSPGVCDVAEPSPSFVLWPAWVSALTAASRANVSVYGIMPTRPGAPWLADGVIEFTGGAGFVSTTKFDRFVQTVWEEASRYYLLGYWPAGLDHPLHHVDVSVKGKGLKVRARRLRG